MTKEQNGTVRKRTMKPAVERMQYYCSNLKILTDFMAIMNIKTPDIAKAIGVTRQSVHHWLTSDNIKLSTLEKIFEAYGFDTVCSYDELSSSKNNITVKSPISYSFDKLEPPRLRFLSHAIRELGTNNKEVSEMAGLSCSAVSGYLMHDDINLARLVDISSHLGLTLHIDLIPIEKS